MVVEDPSINLIPALNKLPTGCYNVELLIQKVTVIGETTIVTFGSSKHGIQQLQCRFGEEHNGLFERRTDMPVYVAEAVEGGYRVFFTLQYYPNRVVIAYATPDEFRHQMHERALPREV